MLLCVFNRACLLTVACFLLFLPLAAPAHSASCGKDHTARELAIFGWDERTIKAVVSWHGENLEYDCIKDPASYRRQLVFMSGFSSSVTEFLRSTPEPIGLFYYLDERYRSRLVDVFSLAADGNSPDRRSKLISFFAAFAVKSEIEILIDTLHRYRDIIPSILERPDALLFVEALAYRSTSLADEIYDRWLMAELGQAIRDQNHWMAATDLAVIARKRGANIRAKLRDRDLGERQLATAWGRIRELLGKRIRNPSTATYEERDALTVDMLIAGPAIWELVLLPEADRLIETSQQTPDQLGILLFGLETVQADAGGNRTIVPALSAAVRNAYIEMLSSGDVFLEAAVVRFRDKEAFQHFAVSNLLPAQRRCVLMQAVARMNDALQSGQSEEAAFKGFAEQLTHPPQRIDYDCGRSGDRGAAAILPFIGVYEMYEKTRLGVELGFSDYLSVGMDVFTVLLPGEKLVGPVAKQALSAIGRETAEGAVSAAAREMAEGAVSAAARKSPRGVALIAQETARGLSAKLLALGEKVGRDQVLALQANLVREALSRAGVESASLAGLRRLGGSLALTQSGSVTIELVEEAAEGFLKRFAEGTVGGAVWVGTTRSPAGHYVINNAMSTWLRIANEIDGTDTGKERR